jgi:hypothetical protein
LDIVAGDVLCQAGVYSPPVDAFQIARSLGLTVAWDEMQEGRARYVRLADRRTPRPQATILLRPDPRWQRQQWAVAHEIGEHVAHRVFSVWGVDPRETLPNAREAVANFLASRILLPTAWFVPDARQVHWDLLALKIRYETASHELIARRMLECPPPVIITIFDQGRITFRRGNLPGRTPPPSADEMACWKQVHRRNKPCQSSANLARISGWPVHEDNWKREILRTEVQEEW